MKLILTAEVDHLGAAGDTVEVKDGYGRNFLLPRGLAIVATRGAQKHADEIRSPARPRPSTTASMRTNLSPPSWPWIRFRLPPRLPAMPESCLAR